MENLKSLIMSTNSRMFMVKFVKANGEIRTMFAKTGIKKFLSKKPNKRKPSKLNENTIRVFDCEKKEYRSFNISNILEFSCGNKKFVSEMSNLEVNN